MVIFELPAGVGAGGLRAATLGSCRVRNPIYALRDRGDVIIREAGLVATHSAPEALQTVRLVLGETRVDDFLSPYVFETPTSPPVDRLAATLADGVDAFIVEISDDKQFVYNSVQLQQNFLSRELVRAHGHALLGWYRDVCLGRPVTEETIQSALSGMRNAGGVADDRMADLLRGIRLRRLDVDEISDALRDLMVRAPGRWTVVGAFLVPGQEGATMQERRTLNEKLAEASARCGAAFYDPSALVVEHGREAVLDGGGANIYEFAETFYPVVGETLVDLAVASVAGTPANAGASRHVVDENRRQARARSQLADRLNRELISLHRERSDDLGVDASGLYAYYAARLGQAQLVGSRERVAFSLIDRYLPPYSAYAVMRAGLGELALLLAAAGRRVIACEPNANRRAAIEEGALHLEHADLLEPGRLSIVATLTPEQTAPDGTLGVGLDVTHFRDNIAAEPSMRRLQCLDGLLIDPRLFLSLRASPPERDELACALRALGFNRRRDYHAEGLQWYSRSTHN